MKTLLFFIFITIHLLSIGQKNNFEVFGSIKGQYKKEIFFFIDNDVAHKDSIKAEIINGKFYFKQVAKLPILCKFHFGENTNFQEIYIDQKKTNIELYSSLTNTDIPDSLGGARTKFLITKINSSKAQDKISEFEKWKSALDSSNKTKEQKNSEYFDKIKSIVEKEPKDKVSAYLIVGGGFLIGRGFLFTGDCPLSYIQIEQLKNKLDISLKDSYEWFNILRLQNTIEKGRNLAIGNAFHNVFLHKNKKDSINTFTFRNKYILLDFWASWCLPCRSSNRELIPLYEQFKSKDFEIVGVSLDEDYTKWVEALKAENYKWTQLIDKNSFNGELSRYYDIRSIPIKILLDKTGKIIATPSSINEIKKILEKLFTSGK